MDVLSALLYSIRGVYVPVCCLLEQLSNLDFNLVK